MKKIVALMMIVIMVITTVIPTQAQAISKVHIKTAMSKEIDQYIKKVGGSVGIEYVDLETGEKYTRNSTKGYVAASTGKLPLAMYIMELADKGKINLNTKLTYHSYFYIGGSGVIQYDKVGTKYTIQTLIKKSMKYSDNIAFSMLRNYVGRDNYVKYMKSLGAKYSTSGAYELTSARDLSVYAQHLYKTSYTSKNSRILLNYLKETVYNKGIPAAVGKTKVAHKVGMIYNIRVSHDYGIIYDEDPYVLSIMTDGYQYDFSNKVIANISKIVKKHHKNKVKYIKATSDSVFYQQLNKKKVMGHLKKNKVYRVVAEKNGWVSFKVGEVKRYIAPKTVKYYEKSPINEKHSKVFYTKKVNAIKATELYQSRKKNTKPYVLVTKKAVMHVRKIDHNWYETIVGNQKVYVLAKDIKSVK